MTMKSYRYLFTAALACGLLLSSCDSGGGNERVEEDAVVQTSENLDMEGDPGAVAQQVKTIEIVAKDLDYTPNELRASPGQQLEVTLINRGEVEHNIEFELPKGEKELESNVQPGNRATLTFQAPQEPGTYTFYCPVKDHKEKGMVGKLIVE